jgi:hypothetical protein
MTSAEGGGDPIDLAHELRTPLHTILTAADLVLSGDAGPVSSQAARLVGEIADAARRLETLSRQLIVDRGGRCSPAAGPAGGAES